MPVNVSRRPVGQARRLGLVLLAGTVVLVSSVAVASAARRPVAASGGVTRAPAAAADGRCQHPWVAPVDAPVTDPFRPPDGPYGPGNRGIEYGTEPGQDVGAVDGGVVVFAGPVAGRPVVVLDHGAGLRSSYVSLLDRAVDRGQVVTRGQLIAVADARFHLGARRDGAYLDPAPLFDRLCEIVRLVPLPAG